MFHFSASKIGIIVAVTLFALFFSLPNVLPQSIRQHGPDWWRPMSLGLDLQGGSYLLLEVDTSAVLKEQLADLEENARGALRDARLRYRNLRTTADTVIVTVDPADRVAARAAIAKVITNMTIDNQAEDSIRITVPDPVKRDRQISAVSQSLEIVRRRIDEFGTSEPSIQRQGADRIIVELPGVSDPTRLEALLGKTAKLTFHMVDEKANPDPHDLPPGTMLLPDSSGNGRNYVVERKVEVDGERLVDAQPTFQNGSPVVSFRFDTAGGRRFGQITSDNVGKFFAIVLDNTVISAPVIKGPIVGGSGIIEGGGFTAESAKDLAVLLRAGALPAPLQVIEKRTVGPGLGADSIHAGASAAILGGVLVVVFMILAYHTFGVFAVIGQAFHMLTLFAVLSVMGGTLTLPGIAGVVLSLGMAVDANVLIYERMREESLGGRTLLNALMAGFSNAYATIIDSNLTNFIAALLLFLLGSGPVRGFAVTLSIGIATSIFSAVMITRLQVWLWYRARKRQTLPI